MAAPAGMLRNIDTAAMNALKSSVIESNAYVLRSTLFVSSTLVVLLGNGVVTCLLLNNVCFLKLDL